MRKHPKHRNHTNPNYNIRPLSPAAVERLLYGESLPDKHTRERLQQARKENDMPDIKTALESALKTAKEVTASTKALTATIAEWADDDQPLNQTNLKEKTMPNHNPIVNYSKLSDGKVRFTETVGVARAVFDHVLHNPGRTRLQITADLTPKGYKKSSVQSLVGQYIRAGHFKKDSTGKIFCMLGDYKPLPSTKAQAHMQAKKAKTTKPPRTITLVPPKSKTAGIAALGVDVFDPKALLNTLSVMQARALYDELRKIFGG